jgi:hypothetical protein
MSLPMKRCSRRPFAFLFFAVTAATAITGNYVISDPRSATTLNTKITAVCLLAACFQVLLYFSASVLVRKC